ncbi:hypothetical protein IPJ70_03170 [Candidatus Campbellbacteria bacterium]|nr:MAG: hypothetical protein IPJ70_03170 [Candidatus Campbellbacteria bacterium]
MRILVEGDNTENREEVVKILRGVCPDAEIVERDIRPILGFGLELGTVGEKFDLVISVGVTRIGQDLDVPYLGSFFTERR